MLELADFRAFDRVEPISGQGIYAYALTDSDALPSISAGSNGLIYIGMTEQGLDVRNHFLHEHSGFSTLRRSLGAILKVPLNLTAYKRSSGASASNHRSYRFSTDGEERLTEWMKARLLIAQHQIHSGIVERERMLITQFEPPLNLTGWSNPQRLLIKQLRAACAAEAFKNGTFAG